MRIESHNAGIFLAIVAGLLSIGLAMWPGPAPQTDVGSDAWLFGAVIVGGAFIVAPFLAEQSTILARAILVVGALTLIASGIFFGVLLPSNVGLVAAVVDIFPAIIALVAAGLIGPARRHAGP